VGLQPTAVAASDAYVRIGNLLLAQKHYDEAAQEFQQAIQSDPTNVAAYYNLGTVFEQQDNVDRAVQLYRKVVEFQPIGIAAADAYVRIGNLLRAQKHYDEAGQEFQRAIESNPGNAGAYYDLGTVYEQQGDAKLALKNYIKATGLAPKYRDAYLGRGRIYAKQKDTKSVARMARQILELELDPEEKYDAYLIIADVYRAADDINHAVSTYQKAIESYPGNSEAYVHLAQLLTDNNRIDEALEVCRQMASESELASTALVSIGNLLTAQKKYDEAEQSYRQAIDATPKESGPYLELARLYEAQGKLVEMEKVLAQASIAFPDDPQTYRLQAQLRERQRRPDEAIRLYRRVVELRPTNGLSSEAHERIGNLMFNEKRYGEAEAEFQMAAQIDPVNAGIHYSLGALYEKQNDMERAMASYAKATEISPKYGEAYRALGHLYAKKGDTKGLAQMAGQILELDLAPTDQYEAHLMIGNAYQEAELYEWATDHFNKAISIAPERLEAYSALGLIYEIQQNWTKARDAYEKIGELSPESWSDVHFRLGQIYVLEKKPEEAEKEFELVKDQVVLANHERLELLRTAYLIIAAIYRKQGKLEAMRKACAEVLSQLQSGHSPGHDASRHQGLACLMLGQYQAAVDTLRQALELNEADAKARLYLAVGLLPLNDISGAQSQLKKAIEQIQYKEDYDVAIEEAETLATQVPEVAGANDVVQTLREASNKAFSRVVAQE
jgi:tetratricopeptide (TPR) repeat protein